MGAYEEVELDDMEWNEELQAYTYQCPCGDLFQISLAELRSGESIARCPSCSLYLHVTYDPVRARCVRTCVRACCWGHVPCMAMRLHAEEGWWHRRTLRRRRRTRVR
jgi:diphthamide biosynthesis protein 3